MRSFDGTTSVVGIPLIVIGICLLIRAVLIINGRLKSPLLSRFQQYTDKPIIYNSLKEVAIWVVVIQIGFVFTLNSFMKVPGWAFAPLLIAGAIAIVAQEQAGWIRRHLPFLMPTPGWYQNLMARTTITERRRIAYMWLRLPGRTRSLYNHLDAMFLNWADLVILGTVT